MIPPQILIEFNNHYQLETEFSIKIDTRIV